MPKPKFLAIDLGAETGRAFVGTLDAGRIILEEIHRFPNVPLIVAGHLRWDVPRLFADVKTALRIAVEKGHRGILSVGVDTWGVDFGLMNTEHNSIDLPFTYRDKRTDGIMEKVFKKIPLDEIYRRTGIQFMQINSLFQLYSLIDNDRGSLSKYSTLLFMPDIFNYLLTGKEFSEYTISSTSQLLNVWSKEFDQAIFSTLGLPNDIMAPLITPGTRIGRILPSIAAETGVNECEVIAVGSHDTASAVAAVPAVSGRWAYLSSGTWSLVGIESDMPIVNYAARRENFTNEGGTNGKITFLQNIVGLWLLQEVRKKWEGSGIHYSYDEIAGLAMETQECGSLVDPADSSFLNPTDMETAIIHFCSRTNQPAPKTKSQIVRTIFDSLALKYRSAIRKLEDVSRVNIERLYIVGGGSRNSLLNQFSSDAAGIPVTAGPVEASVLGNIMVQAITNGNIKSFAHGREMIRESFELREYLPRDSGKWDTLEKTRTFEV